MNNHKKVCAIALVIALFLYSTDDALSQRRKSQTPQTASQANHPKLVLLIAVDQFRYDYLDRFGDLFVADGLRRLLRQGASWTNCNYDHTPTYTAPGHSTLMTGAWPAETGIVANDWPDRASGMVVSNSSDPEDKYDFEKKTYKARWQLLGGGTGEKSSSPRRLMASTIGDELRMVNNQRSKVIGISLKDRAAIMPAGRYANAAYWFSSLAGNMVSSEYYFRNKTLPDWVVKFNASRPADVYAGREWKRILDNESEYIKRAGPDAAVWEGSDSVFPHVMPAKDRLKDLYDEIDVSPFTNEILLNFAKQAIIAESLGEDKDTDVLALSFSANDYVGHRYGPYSQEVMDVTLRTDRDVAELLNFVDRRVGLKNTIVIFTADHGVAPIPEQAEEEFHQDGDRIKNDSVLGAIRAAIKERYGTSKDYIQKFKDGNGNERDGYQNGQIYFDAEMLRRDRISLEDITRVAGDAALKVRGISRYFTRQQILNGSISLKDAIARRVAHGFYPNRSGDLILIYEPFKYLGETTIKATHGSPYSYDTHVPLIFMGGGIKIGRYNEESSPADIAPTLAVLLKIQAPSNSVGRILNEGLYLNSMMRAPQ